MNYYKIFFTVVFCLSSSFTYSQEISNINRAEMGGFVDKEEMEMAPGSSSFKHLLSSTVKSVESSSTRANQVFIQQVGTNNNINTNFSSNQSRVDLNQNGYGNDIDMKISASVIEYEVMQSGNNNEYFRIAESTSEPITGNLKQIGNNNHVENYGSNSISNGLKINIAGDSKSLIIRNFQW